MTRLDATIVQIDDLIEGIKTDLFSTFRQGQPVQIDDLIEGIKTFHYHHVTSAILNVQIDDLIEGIKTCLRSALSRLAPLVQIDDLIEGIKTHGILFEDHDKIIPSSD